MSCSTRLFPRTALRTRTRGPTRRHPRANAIICSKARPAGHAPRACSAIPATASMRSAPKPASTKFKSPTCKHISSAAARGRTIVCSRFSATCKPDEVRAAVEKAFGSWKALPIVELALTTPAASPLTSITARHRNRDKKQAVLVDRLSGHDSA